MAKVFTSRFCGSGTDEMYTTSCWLNLVANRFICSASSISGKLTGMLLGRASSLLLEVWMVMIECHSHNVSLITAGVPEH